MKKEELVNTLTTLFPKAKTELDFRTKFQCLTSIVLSAQSTDKQVNKATKKFFEDVKEAKDILPLSLEKVESYIKTIWLYKNKAKFIKANSKIIVEKYDWTVPKTIPELMQLPWVWTKTAKVFLAENYNWPYLAVDTHVHRVLNRLWVVKTKTPEQTDKKADKYFDDKDKRKIHNSLVLFWRYKCTAINPKCEECPLISGCKHKEKTTWSKDKKK